jgi:hypothetical protein
MDAMVSNSMTNRFTKDLPREPDMYSTDREFFSFMEPKERYDQVTSRSSVLIMVPFMLQFIIQ